MVIDALFFSLILISLILGSYSDIRTREVPDWLNFSLIFSGFGLRAIYSIFYWNPGIIIEGILGFSAFLAIAYFMFYAGQWGGGDSKMLMGLGALIGLRLSAYDYAISFIINIFVAGAIYGLLWTAVLAIIKRKEFMKEFRKIIRKKNIVIARAVVIAITLIILVSLFFIQDRNIKIPLFFATALFFATFYLWVFIKAIEKSCMFKMIDPEKLTEGDWIVKDIVVDGKRICGPKDLGIEIKQINRLIRLKKQKKIKKVLIKEGIPFVPSFLIAFLFTHYFGNIFLLVF